MLGYYFLTAELRTIRHISGNHQLYNTVLLQYRTCSWGEKEQKISSRKENFELFLFVQNGSMWHVHCLHKLLIFLPPLHLHDVFVTASQMEKNGGWMALTLCLALFFIVRCRQKPSRTWENWVPMNLRKHEPSPTRAKTSLAGGAKEEKLHYYKYF